uniref:Uncharacterized protein n=1 Tax=Romanomermis culicivorax TaxID=13658 RepID=A0A915K1K6_ROMCU
MILEETNEREGLQVYRAQIPASESSYAFTNLKPSTKYHVGVIAFVNYQPRQVYRLSVETGHTGAKSWSVRPDVQRKGVGKFAVYWESPHQFSDRDLQGFIIEFRLPNETIWRRYGDLISYRPDQKQFGTELSGLNEKNIYVVRVYIVNAKGEVVGVTDEFNLGSQSSTSCTGSSGVPTNVHSSSSSSTTITYTWSRPRYKQCNEQGNFYVKSGRLREFR